MRWRPVHEQARAYVEARRCDEPLAVLEVGGRFINGGVRDLFPNADPYVSLDIVAGPLVDIVADAATWQPDRAYDLVVCTEVFEHTPEWPAILRTMHAATRDGGRLILTMAGPGRSEHGSGGGAWDGREHYANVAPDELAAQMHAAGWADVEVDYIADPGDTRATAKRR
jgi:SAM-dependent methyltransferase